MSVSQHSRKSDSRRSHDLSSLGRHLLEVRVGDWDGFLQFIRRNKRIVSGPEIQAFLAQASKSQRAGEESVAWTCIHHALLLRRLDQLGENGGEDFLIRLIEGNRQDRESFLGDVKKEYDQFRRGGPGATGDRGQDEGFTNGDTERYGRARSPDRRRNQPDRALDSMTTSSGSQNRLTSRANDRRDYDMNPNGTESSISSSLQDLRIDSPRPVESRAGLTAFFLPPEGIHPQVIGGWAARYLGKDATVRQGDYPKDGRRGFLINSRRTITRDMIATLKRLSQEYDANLGNANTVPDEDRRRASRYMSVESRHQEQEALLEDRSMPPEDKTFTVEKSDTLQMTLSATGFRSSYARAWLDNGFTANFMSKTLYEKLEGVSASRTRQEFEALNGHMVTALGKATLRAEWESRRPWPAGAAELEFFIIYNLQTDLLIGANTIQEHSLQKIARSGLIPMRSSARASLVTLRKRMTFPRSDEGSDSNPPNAPWTPPPKPPGPHPQPYPGSDSNPPNGPWPPPANPPRPHPGPHPGKRSDIDCQGVAHSPGQKTKRPE